jgi:hypothetical protein
MKLPRIVFVTNNLSPREHQIIQALVVTKLPVALTHCQGHGGDPTLPESQRRAAEEVRWLMSSHFPDLDFRIVT